MSALLEPVGTGGVAELRAQFRDGKARLLEHFARARPTAPAATRVIKGLTRDLDYAALDRGYTNGEPALSFFPRGNTLGVVLPNNSPGVHSLWIPAIALKTALVLRPGSAEPWTPYRIIQALIKAGVPAEAFHFYPSDHAAGGEIIPSATRGGGGGGGRGAGGDTADRGGPAGFPGAPGSPDATPRQPGAGGTPPPPGPSSAEASTAGAGAGATEKRRPPLGGSIHEVGTARMSENPKQGVLNSYAQAHDIKNLFVTDGAAFTSIACQNPTLTMMTITSRACDYIQDKLKKGELA